MGCFVISITDKVIASLIASIVTFLQTDVAMVFIGVVVLAILVRCVIMILSFGKEVVKEWNRR